MAAHPLRIAGDVFARRDYRVCLCTWHVVVRHVDIRVFCLRIAAGWQWRARGEDRDGHCASSSWCRVEALEILAGI
jgi:hypothetical protein